MDTRFTDRASFRQALVAAARELDATVKDGPGEAWSVRGGTPGASNPNAAPWGAVASLAGGAWGLSPRPVSLPWTRRRAAEISGVRTRQLDTLIRFARPAEPHEKVPFTAGTSLAERAAAFAWIVAAAALAMALTVVVATLAGLPLVERELARLAGRNEVLARIGADPLPRPAEIEGLGWLGRLGAAFLLATPLAFFLGGLHAAVHAVGERFISVARFAPWGSLFLFSSSLLAFLPRMALPFAIGGAALIPLAAHVGTTLAWGRRRDETLAGPRPPWKPGVGLIAAVVTVLVVVAVLVPTPTSNDNRVHETSRFRDRFLLGHAPGRALAHFYYAYTLYAAEPVKAPFSLDTNVKERQLRTALVIGKFGNDVNALGDQDFSVELVPDPDAATPLIRKRQHDVYVVAHALTRPYAVLAEEGLLSRTIRQGTTSVPGAERVVTIQVPAPADEWKKALHAVLKLGGLESMLLELTWLGWTGVYYVGPLFVLLLGAGAAAAGLSWATRRLSPAGVKRLVVGVFGVSVAGLIAILAARGGVMNRVAALRTLPSHDQRAIEVLASGLKDPDGEVRYEAAYQTFRSLLRPEFPKGGMTAELVAGVARDPEVRVRLWCAAALGLTRDPKVRDALFQALDDPDLLVRYRAAEGLGALDAGRSPPPPETIARLRAMIKSRSWYEGMYALASLRRIDPLSY